MGCWGFRTGCWCLSLAVVGCLGDPPESHPADASIGSAGTHAFDSSGSRDTDAAGSSGFGGSGGMAGTASSCTGCPEPDNGRAVCADGGCSITCNDGWDACGSQCVTLASD